MAGPLFYIYSSESILFLTCSHTSLVLLPPTTSRRVAPGGDGQTAGESGGGGRIFGRIIHHEEIFCKELGIPKHTNMAADGKPSSYTFPKSTDFAIESVSAVGTDAENLIRKLYERSCEEEDLVNRCLNRKPKKKRKS